MKVIAIVVTYGDRFELLKQVIDSALIEGVNKIIVVDNNSSENSKEALQLYELKLNEKIKVFYLNENTGSSGGFKKGLDEAKKYNEFDLVWLLDDDNVPEAGALNKLLQARELLEKTDKNKSEVVLYSYRGDTRPRDKLAVYNGYIKGYMPNNFMGFNFIQTLKIKTIYKKTSVLNYPIVKTNIGPYGGMLLSVNSLNKIGLPNEDFYLYADDHEFSLRFAKFGIDQYLVYPSKLKDIDISFSSGNNLFSSNSSDFKIFYMIRNHVYLSQNQIKSRVIYNLNKNIFLTAMLFRGLPYIFKLNGLFLKRVKLIFKAIKDGESGILGKTI